MAATGEQVASPQRVPRPASARSLLTGSAAPGLGSPQQPRRGGPGHGRREPDRDRDRAVPRRPRPGGSRSDLPGPLRACARRLLCSRGHGVLGGQRPGLVRARGAPVRVPAFAVCGAGGCTRRRQRCGPVRGSGCRAELVCLAPARAAGRAGPVRGRPPGHAGMETRTVAGLGARLSAEPAVCGRRPPGRRDPRRALDRRRL